MGPCQAGWQGLWHETRGVIDSETVGMTARMNQMQRGPFPETHMSIFEDDGLIIWHLVDCTIRAMKTHGATNIHHVRSFLKCKVC